MDCCAKAKRTQKTGNCQQPLTGHDCETAQLAVGKCQAPSPVRRVFRRRRVYVKAFDS